MTHNEIRQKFLKFFEDRGHKIVPSSSLLPDDPSVLFTTAGMQQFKKYYTNPELAPSLNVASIQKSMRTSDIDEVGDERHLTFFEMLGNFSFGGYFKKEAIAFAHEFITQEMQLKIDYVTVFEDWESIGLNMIAPDKESEEIWKLLDPSIKIKKCGRADNFWGPTGDDGPCGPTTEIYVNGIEIWNIVFNEYYKVKEGNNYKPLQAPGIDTGMGLERLAMVSQGKANIFETDLLDPIIELLPEMSLNHKRIFADHMRAIAFLIADGVLPSKNDRGSILRRLIRRIIAISFRSELIFQTGEIFKKIVEIYGQYYPELNVMKIDSDFTSEIMTKEDDSFRRAFHQGEKLAKKVDVIDASFAFLLHQTHGWTYEMVKDFDIDKTKKLTKNAYDAENIKHQAKSREGSVKKFGGHGLLLDTGELKAANEEELKKVTRLHTATHMLQAALRKVLGDDVHQAGSDITAERLRFDFTFNRKLAPEEIKQVENLINNAVTQDMKVSYEELPIEEAKKTGALYFFKEKYPEKVKVYSVGNFSKEFCGGPHVTHTGEIGKFKIIKEESVSTGTRRIRATVI